MDSKQFLEHSIKCHPYLLYVVFVHVHPDMKCLMFFLGGSRKQNMDTGGSETVSCYKESSVYCWLTAQLYSIILWNLLTYIFSPLQFWPCVGKWHILMRAEEFRMKTVISLEYLPALEEYKVELNNCGVLNLPIKDMWKAVWIHLYGYDIKHAKLNSENSNTWFFSYFDYILENVSLM